MNLVPVLFEDAINGEKYLTKMKYGFIEGVWDKEEEICKGYFFGDLEWQPHALYKIEEAT